MVSFPLEHRDRTKLLETKIQQNPNDMSFLLFLIILSYLCAQAEKKPSTTNAEIFLIPTISVPLGELLTINEFFKLSKTNRKFFRSFSKPEILNLVGLRMQQFSNKFNPTFSDLLDLEFRLKPEILEPLWKLVFGERKKVSGEVYFTANTPNSNFWIHNLKCPHNVITIDKILYSFTFKEATFFLWEIEQFYTHLIFHCIRLDPNEPRKQFLRPKATREVFVSQVYDLQTGKLRQNLWKNHEENIWFKKVFSICTENQEKLLNLMYRKNSNQRKDSCVII
jgi:hypothetical protein